MTIEEGTDLCKGCICKSCKDVQECMTLCECPCYYCNRDEPTPYIKCTKREWYVGDISVKSVTARIEHD